MRPIERILTLWNLGLLDSDAVIRWADEAVVSAECPAQDVIDLSCYGPEACLRRAEFEFPARPVRLTFSQAFALKALSTQLESEESVQSFADWASRQAMGEDLSLPEVAFSYQLEHLIVDCQDPVAAGALVRGQLPSMLPSCQRVAAPFLEEAPA
jgi:hypothetical protein